MGCVSVMSWAALNGHVRDPPILELPAAAWSAAGENGEGGDRGAGLGVSRRKRRSILEKKEKKEEEVAGFE